MALPTETQPLLARRTARPPVGKTLAFPRMKIKPLVIKKEIISESISKEETKLCGTELFKQQCHFSLTKHRLAAMHLATLQFWVFTIPMALVAMSSGIMAFLATAGIFEERTNTFLNVFVGCFSFVVVFLQTLSSQLKYDTRAHMHESTAIDLRDLREDLENIENQAFVMVGLRVNEDKLNAAKNKSKGDGDDNGNNGEIESNRNNEEDSLKQIFDGIQNRYNQCLKSCKSTCPMPINAAFNQLDSRINSTLSVVGHNQLERTYGYGYNNVIYFQACNELAIHFSCAFLWPLRLVNPRHAVDTTMNTLKTTICEDGKNYWNVLLDDAGTFNADFSSSQSSEY
jgi:hypothetical protein